jgi:serine/threonine protein phosphatase PrpC
MNRIKFKISAKTDVGLVRTNNEDNFQASSDLAVTPMRWVNNDICQLGEYGALLVVADGMGGMNAGEVASQIAIDTVREEFRPQQLSEEVTKNRFSIEKFMNDVIVKADNNIKKTAETRPETKGMGTTIVLAWLYEGTLYVSWCGDSRAYIYNPKHGLHRLTKDHSYVQQLVDAGKLSEEEAFDFPESNIITRCLSDAKQKAQPESLAEPYKVCDEDIILLCTDGLCGMIKDDEIYSVLGAYNSDLSRTTDGLIQSALNASGADNVTICLCQILSGGNKPNLTYFAKNSKATNKTSFKSALSSHKNSLKMISLCILFLLIGGGIATFFFMKSGVIGTIAKGADSIVSKDSTPTVVAQAAETTTPEESIEPANQDNKISKPGEALKVDSKINGLTVPTTNPKHETPKDDKDKVENGLTLNNDENKDVKKETKDDGKGQEKKADERPVVKEKLPEGKSLQVFAMEHGMKYLDMKHLNPQITDWRKVKPGTVLKVYKK